MTEPARREEDETTKQQLSVSSKPWEQDEG